MVAHPIGTVGFPWDENQDWRPNRAFSTALLVAYLKQIKFNIAEAETMKELNCFCNRSLRCNHLRRFFAGDRRFPVDTWWFAFTCGRFQKESNVFHHPTHG
jgi:hypothetical protein